MSGTPPLPFRWDLARPDRLGPLVPPNTGRPLLWAAELAACAAKVLARAGDAELYFVGRSADSVHDILRGALRNTSWHGRVRRLPVSLDSYDRYTDAERRRLREILAATLPSPAGMASGRDLAFVDIVAEGRTYESLFRAVEGWVGAERGNWPVIRRGLRFLGLTEELHTSPKTWRWWQHAEWTRRLAPGAIVNVSIDSHLFHYLGGRQSKTAPSFRVSRWWDESVARPSREGEALLGLTLAAGYTEFGALASTRAALARGIEAEPAVREGWARRLAGELRRG
ncbi:hypothetical protein AB0I28_11500 [Phytomonospora sp. NPDC050363]|uniref:hypothetical protein n=1 Tax=Phytomonospora sp. NPDC050363 TaxID=3155642 RepID=UPI00340BEDE4